MNTKKLSLLGFLMVLGIASAASPKVFAGIDDSGGGGAIVCRDATGKITSAEMLDLFEGKIRFDHREDPFPVKSQSADEVVRTMLNGAFGDSPVTEKLLMRLMKIRASIQLLPPGIAIHTSADLGSKYAVLIKAGCHLETVGYYETDGSIKVVPEILNALNSENQAAFYLHETIYSIYREFAGDTDSARSRQMTSLLITGTYGEQRRPILFFYELLDRVPLAKNEKQIVIPANGAHDVRIVFSGPTNSNYVALAEFHNTTGYSKYPGISHKGQAEIVDQDSLWGRTKIDLFYRSETLLNLKYSIYRGDTLIANGTLNHAIESLQLIYQ